MPNIQLIFVPLYSTSGCRYRRSRHPLAYRCLLGVARALRLQPAGKVWDGERSRSRTPLVGASSTLVFQLIPWAPGFIEKPDYPSLLWNASLSDMDVWEVQSLPRRDILLGWYLWVSLHSTTNGNSSRSVSVLLLSAPVVEQTLLVCHKRPCWLSIVH